MTVMEIEDLQNECVRETEDHLYRILIGNRKEANKGCSIKIISLCGHFPSRFGVLLVVMELYGIIAHCVIVLSRAQRGKQRRGGEI